MPAEILSSSSRAALRAWASGFKPWWAVLKLGWALFWRYAGTAWLFLVVLSFLLVFENKTASQVVFWAAIVGLLLLLGWCGSEVLSLLQPFRESGSRFGDQRVLQPLDVRATIWVLIAAIGLFVLGWLSMPVMNLEGLMLIQTPLAVLSPENLGNIFLPFELLDAYLAETAFARLPEYAFFFLQGVILALMFLAWSSGLMRKPRERGTRTFALLAAFLVAFIVLWATTNIMDGVEGLAREIYIQGTLSAIGLGIGLFGLWCRHRPSFWKALAFSWLVFAWAWFTPSISFYN